uniref:Beta/gamma crystallin 'Greek key' domain-containing protein n=1 Tax=Xiphophorus couchianus TaxID=32473 RepID=A0A3B5LYG2_9TELE
ISTTHSSNPCLPICHSLHQVTVFEQEHFQGKCPEFMAATWTTSAPSDCHIHHSHLQLGGFERHDCQGQLFILERGEYPKRVANAGSLSYHTECFMSIRPIYCAISKTLMDEEPKLWILLRELHPSLQAVGWFMLEVGSMHVFVCYEYPGYRGQQYLMECERHGGDYQHWRNWGSHCQTAKIQSIRRIRHCGASYRGQQQVELEPKNPCAPPQFGSEGLWTITTTQTMWDLAATSQAHPSFLWIKETKKQVQLYLTCFFIS